MEAMQQRMLYQAREENKRREEERRNKEAEVAAALAVTALGAQQKDNNFMTRVTKSHSTVLDPTSQIKNLHPSKHTTIKVRVRVRVTVRVRVRVSASTLPQP